MDGIVVLNEVIEDARRSRARRILLKIDFAKAYDSVDWNYVIRMLHLMGFPIKWTSWIRECITSVSTNVLVNGSPSGEFILERGLRQGDPLSPFLFLIAAEGLNWLVKCAQSQGLLKGAAIGRESVEVTHLQYADDTLLVLEGTEDNARAAKWILKNFEVMSGLSINYDKSCVYGINMDNEDLERIAGDLGYVVGALPIPYLGLKVGGRVNGKAEWNEVIDRVKGRLRK